MKHINEILFEYVFLPFSMAAYVFFVSFMIKEFITSWQKERKEEEDAENETGGDAN